MNEIYTFVYRGVLADESLDKVGRKSRNSIGPSDAAGVRSALSFEFLDSERVASAERMAIIYTAIHALENSVRHFVSTGMADAHEEDWWSNVPERIRKRVNSRMDDEAKFKWHGARGGTEIEYCDFGDLASIIANNWSAFEIVLVDLEWVKSTLSVLERSRNIVMHGGTLGRQDIERIGINIRDWVRQAG